MGRSAAVIDSEIGELKAAIERAAAVAEIALGRGLAASVSAHSSRSAEHQELCRQLGALRKRVAVAEDRNEGSGALRAELATLLFFARTLQADAENWRAAIVECHRELERERIAGEKEQERLVVEHEQLVRRRDALQSTILQAAEHVAQQYRGECRRTLPVFTLCDGLTVCSVSVSCPRRGFRFAKQWCVTLNRSQAVLVKRE